MSRKLSKSLEDYLEIIYLLEKKQGTARVKDIATHLNVSLPSVTEMVRRLAKRGLAKYKRYGIIRLTKKGHPVAKDIYKKHELLKNFFLSIGVDKKIAVQDACLAEHILSKKTMSKIGEFLRSS